MKQMKIGRSDMVVAPVGVGTMAWSKSPRWGYGEVLGTEDVREAFRVSAAAGLTFFDTAEIYGRGQSERILGRLLDSGIDQHYVATKYAPMPWHFSATAVKKAIDNSLQRLGLDHIDLYQIHFPMSWAKIESLMDALADVVEAGKIRYVGVSNYSTNKMLRADAALAKRGIPLVSNQVEYSLIKRQPESNGLLVACREANICLIAYSPLGRGILTGKYRPGSGPADLRRFYGQFRGKNLASIMPLVNALEEIGQAHDGKTPAQVAINWLARQPVVLPIPGAKNEIQARDNAAAITFELSEEEVKWLDRLSANFL